MDLYLRYRRMFVAYCVVFEHSCSVSCSAFYFLFVLTDYIHCCLIYRSIDPL